MYEQTPMPCYGMRAALGRPDQQNSVTTNTRRVSAVSYKVTAVAAVLVLVVFILGVLGNNNREHALLQSETDQVASVASSSLSNVTSVLQTLATTTAVSNGSTAAFLAQAKPLVTGSVSVALAKSYLSRYVVFAAAGPALRIDQVLSGPPFADTHPGGAGVDTGPVMNQAGHSTATFAAGPPLVPVGDAIFLQYDVSSFAAVVPGAAQAFSGLTIALYGSDRPSPANLVAATSRQLPGAGASAPVPVGNTNWTVVASSGGPLIGTFANLAPVLVLILGLLVALTLGVAVEVAVRRRATSIGATESTTASPATPPTPRAVPETAPHTLPATPLGQDDEPGEQREPEKPEEPEDAVAVGGATYEPPTPKSIAPPPPPQGGTDHAPVSVPAGPGPDGDLEADNEAADFEAISADEDPGDGDPGDDEPLPSPRFYADWRPDPFGRFELRRFFLGIPTSLVKDGSGERYDPDFTEVSPPAPTSDAEVEVTSEDLPPPSASTDEDETVAEENEPDQPGEPAETDVNVSELSDTQALEMVAARVAETIAEELDSLRSVASALNAFLPEGAEPETTASPPTSESAVSPPPPRPASASSPMPRTTSPIGPNSPVRMPRPNAAAPSVPSSQPPPPPPPPPSAPVPPRPPRPAPGAAPPAASALAPVPDERRNGASESETVSTHRGAAHPSATAGTMAETLALVVRRWKKARRHP
jgi:hypothetical protein